MLAAGGLDEEDKARWEESGDPSVAAWLLVAADANGEEVGDFVVVCVIVEEVAGDEANGDGRGADETVAAVLDCGSVCVIGCTAAGFAVGYIVLWTGEGWAAEDEEGREVACMLGVFPAPL